MGQVKPEWAKSDTQQLTEQTQVDEHLYMCGYDEYETVSLTLQALSLTQDTNTHTDLVHFLCFMKYDDVENNKYFQVNLEGFVGQYYWTDPKPDAKRD